MKKEEYLKRYHDLNSQVINLQTKINILEREYINAAPLKVGDKARVTYREFTLDPGPDPICTIDVYIAGISVHPNGEYRYNFVKAKQDGTPSKQQIYISPDKIELLSRAAREMEVKQLQTTNA